MAGRKAGCRRPTSGDGPISRPTGAATGRCGCFLFLFIASLLAEFIANDRPILASYKGEILYPVMVDYPEEKFGGFLARTDYRDPFIQDEIQANGWLDLAADPIFLHHCQLLHSAFGADSTVLDAR